MKVRDDWKKRKEEIINKKKKEGWKEWYIKNKWIM